MVFAHDTEFALAGVAALVNTARHDEGDAVELLPDVEALAAFLQEWRWSGTTTGDQAELRAVRGLRPVLAGFWDCDVDTAVELTNTLLRRHKALPQLLRHDGWPYHLHATSQDAPLPDRMAVEAAMAMVDVIRMDELDRLRLCAGERCTRVLVDLSKNRSRRFCEGGCGNRAHVAAYRARRGKVS